MEIMEIMDPESQMTALQDDALAEGEQLSDEVEDLSNSLREVVQDGAIKPKLHCLMMDPSFSMVTVQSEDSGIVWETASSRCSTPWASEFSTPVSEASYALCAPGTAGRIVFIMDEELMSKRKRKRRSEKSKPLAQVSHQILAEAERPAMVEVSLPNVTPEKPEEHKMANLKEERHQLFSLVSEGSEILNIIAPPKISTVDEEESRDLEDNLYYLEETPAVKSAEIPDEPERDVHPETEEAPKSLSVIPEPTAPLPRVQVSQSRLATEDYFEKFTLCDIRAPSGAAPLEEAQPETEVMVTGDVDDEALCPEAEPLSGVSAAVSVLDISGEHLDDVFYGAGGEPPSAANIDPKEKQLSKSSLKESGSALFGREEPVLTPIYLPEGPPKIIDQNLLEEPKALAFQYSDLYADAIGTRKKLDDDAESMTSEKSFHSQQSDSEDRGYLEKFVLKVETLDTETDVRPETCSGEPQDPFRPAGLMERRREEVEHQGEEQEEITDFFRNSASSSPCEPVDFERLEKEEPEVVRTPRVTFKDEPPQPSDHQPLTEDTDFSEEFLPVEISEKCPAWEENLPVVRIAVKTTSSRTDDVKNEPLSGSPKSFQTPVQAQNAIKPINPQHKPFLDLMALMPVENEEEKDTTESEKDKDNTVSDASGEEKRSADQSQQDVKDSRRESCDD